MAVDRRFRASHRGMPLALTAARRGNQMDRPIGSGIRRRQAVRRVLVPGFAVLVGLGSIGWLRS